MGICIFMKTLHFGVFVATLYALLSLLVTPSALAQRGSSPEYSQTPWESTTQGFPGYFDTNMPEKGSLVVEFPPMIYGILPTPFSSVDYGVTENFSVGTNAAVTALPWLLGGKGASIKLRSLIYGDDEQQSAITYYAGGLAGDGKNQFTASYHTATWNHAWRLASRHILFANGHYHRFNLEIADRNSIEHANVYYMSMLMGGGYQFLISPKWSLQSNLLISTIQDFEADNAGSSMSVGTNVTKAKTMTATLVPQVQWHAAKNWMFGVGITGIYFGGTGLALPWFTWSKRW
jgi:hypothetical protein